MIPASAIAEPPPTEPDRVFRAVRAHLRQEFAAPAAAIVGYAEMLLEDAGRSGLEGLTPDLQRIQTAGLALQRLIGDVLSSGGAAGDAETFGQRLRHDLRTPINAIKGYGEMLLEDVEDAGAADLAHDLRRLLTAADEMLGRIDALVGFNHEIASVEARDPLRTGTHLVSRTLQSMSPVRIADRQATVGTILVVDDNESNRDLLARRLIRDGHRVELAEGGAQALRAVGERPFDLVLLDLMMPEISGFEVLTRLKADERTRELPVIMISALDEMDSIVRCIEAGAVDYLPKPFEPTLLHARIGSCLDNKRLRDRERQILEELRHEKARNDTLLLSILPGAIVERIKAGDGLIADDVAEATILFADIVGFTPLAGSLEASALVRLLNAIFSTFDRLAKRHGAEKIKTVGDAYMAALGIPEPRADHAEAAARLAFDMLASLDALSEKTKVPVSIRIGLHCGPVVAGVIGERKFAYDVWGHTVNVASRLESQGVPGRIHVSEPMTDRLSDRFAFESRGEIMLKGTGAIRTFLLLDDRSE